MTKRVFVRPLRAAIFALVLATAIGARAQVPQFDHVVVVIFENHSFSDIIGSADAPTFNALAAAGANIVNAPTDPTGLISGSHAVRHPSQPNYLELYSGSNQSTIQDGRPGTSSEPFSSPPPFTTPNLGASLRNAGYSFATYSQSLPSVGFDGDSATSVPGQNQYERKHNPVSNWVNDTNPTANQLPSTVNQPFTTFQNIGASPGGFANLPTVSFVVPDEQNDMHDGSIAQADSWLQLNIVNAYLAWAMAHNSLLIITFDEDGDNTPTNQIPTIFAGAHVVPGNYTEMNLNLSNPHVGSPTDPGIQTPTGTAMNHYNVLSTIEDAYGLAHIGGSIDRPAVTDIFAVPEPSTVSLMTVGALLAGLSVFIYSHRKRPVRARKRKKMVFLYRTVAIGLLQFATADLRATTVIAPNELPDPNGPGTLPSSQTYGDTSNLFPLFPGAGVGLHYQQVYAASQFLAFAPGGEDITAIAFRVGIDAPDRLDHGAFATTIPLIQFSLSTTSATPDNLSSTFAGNLGADAITVYGVPGVGSPLAVSSAGDVMGDPAEFDIVVTLTTPFHYNPANGNLLLDIQNFAGAASPTGIELDGTFADGDAVSRAINFGSATAATGETDTSGVVTEFIAAVPEPGSLALTAFTGIALLFVINRRRVRRLI